MDWITKWRFILASGSPRRSELLKLAGFDFEVRQMDVNEDFPDNLPANEVAVYIARKKALAQKDLLKDNELLIAADTVVVSGEKILGKPVDRNDAINMLQALSGKKHRVISGVYLLSSKKEASFSTCSIVHFEPISKEEIDYYIDHFKPFDKAGSYGIQEWIGINKIKQIEGSYTNIMGLPTADLYEAILAF